MTVLQAILPLIIYNLQLLQRTKLAKVLFRLFLTVNYYFCLSIQLLLVLRVEQLIAALHDRDAIDLYLGLLRVHPGDFLGVRV